MQPPPASRALVWGKLARVLFITQIPGILTPQTVRIELKLYPWNTFEKALLRFKEVLSNLKTFDLLSNGTGEMARGGQA